MKKNDVRLLDNPLLRVLEEISAHEGQSIAMLAEKLGMSTFAVRRAMLRLENSWGVRFHLERYAPAPDGTRGSYSVEDYGPFSAVRVSIIMDHARANAKEETVEEALPLPDGAEDPDEKSKA